MYRDRSGGEGSGERSKSTSSGQPYNVGADFSHDVTRPTHVLSKRAQKPPAVQSGQSIRSTIVMPMPVPHNVAELEQ